jgi:Tir chaperone protein (CesT) family
MNMNGERRLIESLEQLGERNNIAGLTLEPNGCAGIESNDGRRIFVKFDRERDRVFVYQALLPLHAVDASVLQRGMELNLLEAGTEGGVLSLSQMLGALVYHTSIAGSRIDAERLQDAMEAVLANGERLTQLLV